MLSPITAWARASGARRIVLVVMLAGSAMVTPPGARDARAAGADENAAIGKITLLNRQAIEEYRRLNFDEAQRLLDQALDLAASTGLTQHPVRARTYVTLGVVTAGGLKRRDVAVRLFRKALQIQPEIQLSTELASPDVQVAFDEAVQTLGNEPKVERSASELLVHEPVTKGNRGEAITIAVTPDDALHVDRLVLAYRAAGASTFSKVKMQKQSDGVFEAAIPAPATDGAEVAYYVEARDLDDKLVAGRGSPIAPLVIALLPGPAAVDGTAAGEGEPAARASVAPTATAVAAPPFPTAPPRDRWVVALLIGSGGGWSRGTAEATGYPIGGTRLGWSRLGHLAPQVGYLVTPRLLVGVWGRFQLVRGADPYTTPPGSSQCGGDGTCAAATGAFAGGVSAAWLFGASDDLVKPYVALAAGAGYARQVVRVPAGDVDCAADRTADSCLDTARIGPLLGGPGFGAHVRLSRNLRLVLAVQSLFGAPRFTVDIDASLGLALVL